MSKVEKQRDDHADIMPTIEEAKVFAMAKVENQVHRMETLHKELAEAEAEFNELKGNEAHLDQFDAEACATVSQYNTKL